MRCPQCNVFQHKKSCKFEVFLKLLFQSKSDGNSIFTDNLVNLLREITEDITIERAEELLLTTPYKFDVQFTAKEQHVDSITIAIANTITS